ncbi:MAG: KH domain-containing protein [Chthonomonadales bacterium]
MAAAEEPSLLAFIRFVVQELVDQPEQVHITEVPGEGVVTYEVRVAAQDLGKVIGKQGRIANALRTVAKAVAMKEKRKVYVEIIP